MVQALREGVVDFIATDHAPHGQTDKLCTFDEAANGISVLETALGSPSCPWYTPAPASPSAATAP